MRRKQPAEEPLAEECGSWSEIAARLERFEPPEVALGPEGEFSATTWAFRGLKSASYALEPSIERLAQGKSMEWAALERLVVGEFKARARVHLSPGLLPADEFSWLAQMQHYGVPTRLLDFTFSPYVALYFAVRDGAEASCRKHARLWAIETVALNEGFRSVSRKASLEDAKRKGHEEAQRPRPVSMHLDDFSTDRDEIDYQTDQLQSLIAKSLFPKGTYRGELNRNGCVCAAAPPVFNQRLVCQQGLFVVNLAESLTMRESLEKTRARAGAEAVIVDIPAELCEEVERQLFQMNIHDQALFPDLEGMSGYIRQKARLHWK